MKALFENLHPGVDASFLVKSYHLDKFTVPFHFHPEYELTLIVRGEGKRYVGKQMDSFHDGDLVLLGADLPHCWKSGEKSDVGEGVVSIVIQFLYDFMGTGFFERPEMVRIQNLLKRSASGIRFFGEETDDIVRVIEKLAVEDNVFKRMMLLLEILDGLAGCKDFDLLDAGANVVEMPQLHRERLNTAMGYIIDNFQSEIVLSDVASAVNMSPNAFCRYFKRATNKTFMETVIDYRINFAMQQLLASEKTVLEIALESGFGDVSHFYKLFKRRLKISPVNYRRDFQKGI